MAESKTSLQVLAKTREFRKCHEEMANVQGDLPHLRPCQRGAGTLSFVANNEWKRRGGKSELNCVGASGYKRINLMEISSGQTGK